MGRTARQRRLDTLRRQKAKDSGKGTTATRKASEAADRQATSSNPAFIGFEDILNQPFRRGEPGGDVIGGKFRTSNQVKLLRAFRLRSERRKSFKTIIGVRNLQARRGGTAIGRKTLLGGKKG